MLLHLLHVSVYCGHHQEYRAFAILSSVIPPYTDQRLHTGSARNVLTSLSVLNFKY
jgi:hypothetical protein